MIDNYGYGLNWKGHYDPELMHHFGRRSTEDGSQFSETVKLVLLAGKYGLNTTHGRHYAMARNLAPKLAAAYDAAMADVDVLVMPTLPMRATAIPPRGRRHHRGRRPRAGDAGQHLPLRRHGPPRLLGAGRARGRPAGRDDDRRPPVRGRHRPARRPRLRAGRRRLPAPRAAPVATGA